MDFSLQNDDGHLVVKIDGNRLTGSNAPGMARLIRPVLQASKSITIDCSRLTLVDSGGLVGLVMVAKLIDAEEKDQAYLKNLHPSVQKLIRLSHLDNHFKFETNSVA